MIAALAATGCGRTTGPATAPSSPAEPSPAPSVLPAPSPITTAPPSPAAVTSVPYRVEVRAQGLDPATVTATIDAILTDARGWARAGFVFVLDPDGEHVITVAEGAEVDVRCAPYDTGGRYSCQLGTTVNLNADRWRTATPEWTGSLEDYRVMLVNHEVGHLIGLHHPRPQCPGPGLPAPIMAQQSTELGDCLANPWPLAWEVDLAASRVEPFAPGYQDEPEGRPSPPPVTQ